MEKIWIHYAQRVQVNLDQVAKERKRCATGRWPCSMRHSASPKSSNGAASNRHLSAAAMRWPLELEAQRSRYPRPVMPLAPRSPRSLVDLRCSHFHPSAGDEQVRPGLVVQAADLNDGMTIGGVVNELTAANVHPCMRDVLLGRAEK
jgi:hypothetical protein